MTRWRAVLMATAAGLALAGCDGGPKPEAMARAIVIAQPSSEALEQGDWRALGSPTAEQSRQMAEHSVSARAYRAGLARLQRDAGYRDRVARAMLAELAKPPVSAPGSSRSGRAGQSPPAAP
ncbi:MAG: hypothetical protein HZB16_02455 [Armatimonadetes bacterium]|nr:hypothetical protein [Armatimonadota bacterium]